MNTELSSQIDNSILTLVIPDYVICWQDFNSFEEVKSRLKEYLYFVFNNPVHEKCYEERDERFLNLCIFEELMKFKFDLSDEMKSRVRRIKKSRASYLVGYHFYANAVNYDKCVKENILRLFPYINDAYLEAIKR